MYIFYFFANDSIFSDNTIEDISQLHSAHGKLILWENISN